MWKRYFAFVMAMMLMFYPVPVKVFAEEGVDSVHSGTEAVEVEEKSEGEDEAGNLEDKEQFDEENSSLSENDSNEDELITGGDGAKEDIGSEGETGECGAEDEEIDGELLPNESVDSGQEEEDAVVSVENGVEETDGGDGQSNSIEKSDGNIASGRYKNEEDGSDITWVISADGKLTVTGTGNFRPNENVTPDGELSDAEICPWLLYDYRIESAEIRVTGTTNASGMFFNCSEMKSVDLSAFDTSEIVDMSNMFRDCSSLTNLDFSSFDTSKVKDMSYMFLRCSSLESLDVSCFNTGNATDMKYMFSGCSRLCDLDLTGFRTDKAVNLQGMFSECSGLKELDLSSFNTDNVVHMSYMFEKCDNLENLNLSSFNTRNLAIMGEMFSGCKSLKSLDLSSFDLSNMESDDNYVFKDCEALISIYIPSYVKRHIMLPLYDGYVWRESDGNIIEELPQYRSTSVLITKNVMGPEDDLASGQYGEITWRINGNGKLTVEGQGEFAELAKDSKNKWIRAPWYSKRFYIKSAEINVANMTDASYMFYDCNKMSAVDVSRFNTSQVTNMQGMFLGCRSLKEIDLSGFNTSNVVNMSEMFSMRTSNGEMDTEKSYAGSEKLDISSFNTEKVTDMSEMFMGCGNLKSLDVSNFDTSNVTNMNCMFGYCSSLANLDLNSFHTSNVTDMQDMFGSCVNLTSLDLSSFDTSNVTDMNSMFSCCNSLSSLNVSSFNTSKVTNMKSMFLQNQLSSLDVSGFDTSKVTDMSSMFHNCRMLKSLDVSHFDTSQVTDMSYMFFDCGQGQFGLDLSHFDTSKVTDMSFMFESCNAPYLDVSNFNTSKVVYMRWMFSSSSLVSVNLGDFDTGNVQNMSYMFSGCSRLKELDLSSFDIAKAVQATNILELCSALNKIHTPKNLKQFIELPKAESGDAWQDGAGNTYTELPMNLGYSITISRKGGSGSTETGKQTLSVSGIEIGDKVYDGDPNSYTGAVVLKDASGKLVSDVSLTHSYSGTIADGSVYAETEDGPSQVGNYTLTFAVTGASADQYVLNQPEYSFCITSKEATIIAKTVGIEIGGQIPKVSELKYVVDGLVKNDE